MESWRKVWRVALEPLAPTMGLEALRNALLADDPKLIQGATTVPAWVTPDADCEAACVIGYIGWKGNDLTLASDVEEWFAKTCFAMDQLLKEPAACHWFINWADFTPRETMRQELLAEVNLALENRKAREAEACKSSM